MKLHIECLQEKLDNIVKERDLFKKNIEGIHKQEVD